MDIFDRYAPFIQDFIYRNDWQNLRSIQVAAGDAIFNTDDHVLLAAATASGKTEAAFFPILTLLDENPSSSVGVIYIGPLKALINDQFERLNDLCEEAQIPVWHWHGDVPQSHKNKMLKKPSGILQITPESLEAMLIRKHAMIPKLFGDLRFIVIDEVHSLMRGDRGGQTMCLIERLSRLAGVNPRRVGLSATIGDPKTAGQFLSQGTNRRTVIPKIVEKGATWRISMEHFYVSGRQMTEKPLEKKDDTRERTQENNKKINELESASDKLPLKSKTADKDSSVRPSDVKSQIEAEKTERKSERAMPQLQIRETERPTDSTPENADPGLGYIFEHTRGHKCLVFVNSREECETVTATLRQYCEANGEPDRFLIHHGNLSVSYRQTAEDIMKDEEQFMTTVTTATLELGIDIGKLERAFQIDAPATVSSFLQRMGRTGRRGAPQEMWFVMREDEPEARAMLPETIPWELLQGISLVQLYLEEKWVEPPQPHRLPYSLLYHQTMSTLASCGELSPAVLAARVLSLAQFRSISQEDYKVLLRHLIKTDHIQQTENGGLIVGLAGERVTNSFKFYAVFQENEEYTVRCESQELGTIAYPPAMGDKIAIAGRVWTVDEVDRKRHLVYCEPARGTVPAYFGQCPGDIHTHILKRMQRVLEEDQKYPYLLQNASARLALARHQAKESDMAHERLIPLGGTMWCLFPWLGSYSFLALERFIRIKCADRLGLKSLSPTRPYYIELSMKVGKEEFFQILAEEVEKPFDPMELIYPREVPVFEKYDEYVPVELVKKGFAYGVLDIDEMRAEVRSWRNRFFV